VTAHALTVQDGVSRTKDSLTFFLNSGRLDSYLRMDLRMDLARIQNEQEIQKKVLCPKHTNT
jgi:hypothetical protein